MVYLGIDSPELFDPVVEGEDLSGTNEGEVQGVEEEHEVLAKVVAQLQLLQSGVYIAGLYKVPYKFIFFPTLILIILMFFPKFSVPFPPLDSLLTALISYRR